MSFLVHAPHRELVVWRGREPGVLGQGWEVLQAFRRRVPNRVSLRVER